MENYQPIQPRPVTARQSAGRGAHQHDGFTPQQIALQAIITIARKPQTEETRAALRAMILRFNSFFSLDF